MKKVLFGLVFLAAAFQAHGAPVQLTKPVLSTIQVKAKDLLLKTELPYDCVLKGTSKAAISLLNWTGDVEIPVNNITAPSVENAAELSLTHFRGDIAPAVQGQAVVIQIQDRDQKYEMKVQTINCTLKSQSI